MSKTGIEVDKAKVELISNYLLLSVLETSDHFWDMLDFIGDL